MVDRATAATLVEVMAALDPEFAGPSWARWRVAAKALDGLPLSAEEEAIFEHHTGRTRPPSQPPREAFFIAGRRAGKSRFAAVCAQRAVAFRQYHGLLAPGERAIVGVAGADREQARNLFNYAASPFETNPALRELVVRRTRWEIELRTGASVEVRTAHYGRIRGRTFAGFVADELAFWTSDDGSNPADEVVTAIKPALATIPNAQLIVISTPYARRGPLWHAFERYFGKDDDAVLVWRGTSLEMNPTLDGRLVMEALDRDEAAARAEWLAEWRRDIESFVSREAVEACVVTERRELPWVSRHHYVAFVDPSGGSQDSMTLAVAHHENGTAVLDALRERQPPFSPEDVTREFAELLKQYRVTAVTGDRFGGEWPRERFSVHGITYQLADKPKSDLYRELLPPMNSKRIELLDTPRLIAQLCGLERRTARGGRDSIDHGPNAHDDLANAAAGALVAAISNQEHIPLAILSWSDDSLTRESPWRSEPGGWLR